MFFQHKVWSSFEFVYVTTQVFVAIGTCFLAFFSAWVTYKAYKENNVANWLKLEFATLIENSKSSMTSLCINLRNNGKMPIRVSHAVVMFIGSNKILDNVYFSLKEEEEVGILNSATVCMEPVRIKQVAGELKNSFDVIDFYKDKIEHLDIGRIKRIRISVITNLKFYKYELNDEEMFNIISYLKDLKHNIKEEIEEVKEA